MSKKTKVSDNHVRFLYVIGALGFGGSERQLYYLLRALDRKQYPPAVAVWAYDPSHYWFGRIAELGVPIFDLGSGSKLARLRKLTALVRNLNPEVVQSYSFYANFACWWAARAIGRHALGALRIEYKYEIANTGRAGFLLCAYFPRTLVSNNAHGARSAETFGRRFFRRRTVWVPNAVDCEDIQATPLPTGEHFEILGIGRLAPQKAWDNALTALAMFARKTNRPWRFRLCGEGALEASLRKKAADLGLEDRVHFVGHQDDVKRLLAESHVLILTSHSEGTPNVVLEAMAAARPVVATSVGDVPEILTDGTEGFVVRAGDTSAICERLVMLASEPALTQQMGNAARARVQQFSPNALMERTFNSYKLAGWKDSNESTR